MSEVTQRLRTWANAAESGGYRQGSGTYYSDREDTYCILGCGMRELTGVVNHTVSAVGAITFIAGTTTEAAIVLHDQIAIETCRIFGMSVGIPPTFRHSLPVLNDVYNVDFPTFARVIRTVAYQMEEAEAGPPIVADPDPVELTERERAEMLV